MKYSQYLPLGISLFVMLTILSFFNDNLTFSCVLLILFWLALAIYFTLNFQSFYLHAQSNQYFSPRELKYYFLAMTYLFYFILIGVITGSLVAGVANLILSLTLQQLLLNPLYLISTLLISLGLYYFIFSYIYKYVSKPENFGQNTQEKER